MFHLLLSHFLLFPLLSIEMFRGFSMNKADWVLDKFDVTVPMSTYLVAYTINDFEFKESPADGDVVFRIWARRDAISQVNAKIIRKL